MNEPLYFLKLELENFRCFTEKVLLDLSDNYGNWKKWTLILGDNGLGKTSVLQSIASLEVIKYKEGGGVRGFTYSLKNAIAADGRRKKNAILGIRAKLSQNFPQFKDTEKEDEGFDLTIRGHAGGGWGFRGNFYMAENRNDYNFLIYSYGANRVMGSSSLSDNLNDSNSDTLFDSEKRLINADEWLLQLDYAASKESSIRDFANKKREQVKKILIDLLPDVGNIRFTVPVKTNLKSSVEFETSFGWVGIHQLSLGYKTMVAWVVDLAARMFERYPESSNPLEEPAIVLVDEIDLHLHPKWQRKIFDYLSDKFPKTQFIVTAHSPLIVQSAPNDANIVVLRKEGNHVIIDNDIKSVRNWRLDQIMSSDLFGIGSSRDPETEKWLEERKKLLQKKELNDKEEQRLKELNQKAHGLPTAENEDDIEAMDIIRKAAEYLKSQKD